MQIFRRLLFETHCKHFVFLPRSSDATVISALHPKRGIPLAARLNLLNVADLGSLEHKPRLTLRALRVITLKR